MDEFRFILHNIAYLTFPESFLLLLILMDISSSIWTEQQGETVHGKVKKP